MFIGLVEVEGSELGKHYFTYYALQNSHCIVTNYQPVSEHNKTKKSLAEASI